MFETNAMVLPSGDQAVPAIARVMKSFSIDRSRSTLALGLLEICLGSVMACGAGRVCVRAIVLIIATVDIRIKLRISSCARDLCRPYGTQLFCVAYPALPCRAILCRLYEAGAVKFESARCCLKFVRIEGSHKVWTGRAPSLLQGVAWADD